jgi:NADH-quinone oxidoreductase subunit E
MPIPNSGWPEKIAEHFAPDPKYLIPILQFLQAEAGYLSPEAMQSAARYLRISESKVYGVASFYAQFHFEPRGLHKVTVCRGTACHVRGSGRLLGDLEKHLGVAAGGTTEDLKFTLETVACFGACALAPVAVVDGRVHGRQSSASLKELVDAKGAAAGGTRARRSKRKKPARAKKKK